MLKKFRRGESIYTCNVCKKSTRNTGGDEISCQLCLDCFNLASIDNYLSDNGEIDDYKCEVDDIFNRRPELIPLFADLAKAR